MHLHTGLGDLLPEPIGAGEHYLQSMAKLLGFVSLLRRFAVLPKQLYGLPGRRCFPHPAGVVARMIECLEEGIVPDLDLFPASRTERASPL